VVVDHDDVAHCRRELGGEARHLSALAEGASDVAGSPIQFALPVTITVRVPSLPRNVTVSPPT
jgi:hypothetical protein